LPRILIVDDEAAIRTLLSVVFQGAGYEVRSAAAGHEAVTLLDTEAFDAVLSDIVMPGMDGHELMRWVNQRHPDTAYVLMSGYDVGCLDCPKSAGCTMLRKPFMPRDAVSLVERVISGAR
jgi:DNA-binding NtrC family response regulator